MNPFVASLILLVLTGRYRGSLPVLTPGDSALVTSHLIDRTERRRTLSRSTTGDSAEHEQGVAVVEERVVQANGGDIVRIVSAGRSTDATANYDDTLELSRATLAPIREQLHFPAVRWNKSVVYRGDRLDQHNDVNDTARAFSKAFPVRVFAFSELDYVVRSLPLRAGYAALLPLYSEGDDSLEIDTVRVVGPSREGDWMVRFADPMIVTTYGVDPVQRTIVSYEVAPRRRPNVRIRRVSQAAHPSPASR